MKSISIIKEKMPGEYRVIALPEDVVRYVSAGFKVYVEEGAISQAHQRYRKPICQPRCHPGKA